MQKKKKKMPLLVSKNWILTSALIARSSGERNTRIKSFTNGKISSIINGPIN